MRVFNYVVEESVSDCEHLPVAYFLRLTDAIKYVAIATGGTTEDMRIVEIRREHEIIDNNYVAEMAKICLKVYAK